VSRRQFIEDTKRNEASKSCDENASPSEVEMHSINSAVTVNQLHVDEDEDEDDDANDPQWNYASSSIELLLKENEKVSKKNRTRLSRMILVENEKIKATWIKGARALDRLSRTFFSLTYIAIMISFFIAVPISGNIH
jgi:hypothetical protein